MASAAKAQEVTVAEQAQGNVVATDAASIMDVITRAASDPSINVEKLEKLTALYERITARNAEQAFNAALTEAQKEIRPVAADASNPQTKSKYASYFALDKALRHVITKHGFALSFTTEPGATPDVISIICDVSHTAGHTRRYSVPMPSDGKGAKGGDVMTKTHAVGAAMTYGQRYLLKMIFNIVIGEDDDGNSATGNDPITAEQAAALKKMISDFDAIEAKIVEHAGKLAKVEIKTVEQIPARVYDRTVRALNDWALAQRQKPQGQR